MLTPEYDILHVANGIMAKHKLIVKPELIIYHHNYDRDFNALTCKCQLKCSCDCLVGPILQCHKCPSVWPTLYILCLFACCLPSSHLHWHPLPHRLSNQGPQFFPIVNPTQYEQFKITGHHNFWCNWLGGTFLGKSALNRRQISPHLQTGIVLLATLY